MIILFLYKELGLPVVLAGIRSPDLPEASFVTLAI